MDIMTAISNSTGQELLTLVPIREALLGVSVTPFKYITDQHDNPQSPEWSWAQPPGLIHRISLGGLWLFFHLLAAAGEHYPAMPVVRQLAVFSPSWSVQLGLH